MAAAAERILAPSRNARETLPRSLVGRPSDRRDEFLDIFESDNPPRFCVGDILKFFKTDGWSQIITILGFKEGGHVDMMWYDGRPHHFICCASELEALRIVEIRSLPLEDVRMYRDCLGLDAIQ